MGPRHQQQYRTENANDEENQIQLEPLFDRDELLYTPPSSASSSGRMGGRRGGLNMTGNYIAQLKMLEAIYVRGSKEAISKRRGQQVHQGTADISQDADGTHAATMEPASSNHALPPHGHGQDPSMDATSTPNPAVATSAAAPANNSEDNVNHSQHHHRRQGKQQQGRGWSNSSKGVKAVVEAQGLELDISALGPRVLLTKLSEYKQPKPLIPQPPHSPRPKGGVSAREVLEASDKNDHGKLQEYVDTVGAAQFAD